MDVYTEKTIDLLEKHGQDANFSNLLSNNEMPAKNKLTLIYLRIQEIEELAKQEIMAAAMQRRAERNGR